MKERIIHSIMFLGLFCAPYNQLLYWAAVTIMPFLLYGFNKRKSISNIEKSILRSYILVGIITLLSGFLLFEFYHPTKAACMMFGSCIVNWCVFKTISDREDLFKLFDGAIIACFIFSIVTFLSLYHGGMAFSFDDEDSWLGKNVISLDFYLGIICSAFMLKISRRQVYWLPLVYFMIFVLLTTSLKIIIGSLFLFAVVFIDVDRKGKLTIFFLALLAGFFFKNLLVDFFESSEGTLIMNRIYTLFGLTRYTTMDLGFVDGREDLMKSALLIFKKYPLGVGLENTRLFMGTYSHNTFVELLCGGSLLLLGSFLLYIYRLMRNVYILGKNTNLRLISIGILISILFISAAMKIYDSTIALFILFLLVKVNICLYNEKYGTTN